MIAKEYIPIYFGLIVLTRIYIKDKNLYLIQRQIMLYIAFFLSIMIRKLLFISV